jgi:hypothetical protein
MADPGYIAADGTLTDGEAWVGIATTTLGSDTAYVTFTSTDDGQVGDWSQYMDLVLISYCRGTKSAATVQYHLTFNANTDSIYAFQRLQGDGANDNAYTETTNDRAELHTVPGASAGANIFGCVINHFFDINSGKYKSLVSQVAADADGSGSVALFANTWRSQAPLTSIKIWPDANNWLAASTFSLFGILPRMVA